MMSLITFRTDLDQIIDDHFAAEVRADVPAIVATFSPTSNTISWETTAPATVATKRLPSTPPFRRPAAGGDRAMHRYYGDDIVVDESLVLAVPSVPRYRAGVPTDRSGSGS